MHACVPREMDVLFNACAGMKRPRVHAKDLIDPKCMRNNAFQGSMHREDVSFATCVHVRLMRARLCPKMENYGV